MFPVLIDITVGVHFFFLFPWNGEIEVYILGWEILKACTWEYFFFGYTLYLGV